MKKRIKKYLIPQEENEYKPHSLRKKSLLAILSFVIVLEIITLVLITPLSPDSFKGYFTNLSAIFSSVLVEKTNETRLEANKNALAVNDKLTMAAQLKANDMANKSYFAHTSPEGLTPWYFINQAGYSYSNAGENLAVNFVDTNDVHRAWMNSPTHKANILRDGFQEIGIATAEGKYKGRDAIFVVQYFGAPAFQPAIVNSQPSQNSQVTENDTNQQLATENDVLGANTESEDTDVLGVDLNGEVINNPEEIKKELAQADTQNLNTTIEDESLIVNNSDLTWYEKLKASPRLISTLALLVVGFFVLLAVLIKIFIKPKVQFPHMIMNGLYVVLIVIIFALVNDLAVAYFAQVL